MVRPLAALALVLALLSAPPVAAASLLVNGSFEEAPGTPGQNGALWEELGTEDGPESDIWTRLPGWRVGGKLPGIEVRTGQSNPDISAPDGNRYILLDTRQNTRVFQTLFLEVGQYALSFWYRALSGDWTTDEIAVRIKTSGSPPIFHIGVGHPPEENFSPERWAEIVIDFGVDRAGFYSLHFESKGREDGSGGMLDNVRLDARVPAPVPLPASATALLVALAALALLRRAPPARLVPARLLPARLVPARLGPARAPARLRTPAGSAR